MVVLMVPLLVLLVMLEVRRFDRIRSEPTVIVDGSLQVAMTSCGPVQGYFLQSTFRNGMLTSWKMTMIHVQEISFD